MPATTQGMQERIAVIMNNHRDDLQQKPLCAHTHLLSTCQYILELAL